MQTDTTTEQEIDPDFEVKGDEPEPTLEELISARLPDGMSVDVLGKPGTKLVSIVTEGPGGNLCRIERDIRPTYVAPFLRGMLLGLRLA